MNQPNSKKHTIIDDILKGISEYYKEEGVYLPDVIEVNPQKWADFGSWDTKTHMVSIIGGVRVVPVEGVKTFNLK